MNKLCLWEDCDQEALYCEGHALEFANVANENEAIILRCDKQLLLAFVNRIATESSDPVAVQAAESVLAEFGQVPIRHQRIVQAT